MKIRGLKRLLYPALAGVLLTGCNLEAPQTMSSVSHDDVTAAEMEEAALTLVMAEVGTGQNDEPGGKH